MARELGPQNIHVAHPEIDSRVDNEWVRHRITAKGGFFEGRILMNPVSIAETYWHLHRQPRDAWTHEPDLRPNRET